MRDPVCAETQFAKIGEQVKQRLERGERVIDPASPTWHDLAAAGLWRIPIPACFQGAGQSWIDAGKATYGLARSTLDLGFVLSLIAHMGLVRLVMRFGTKAQKESLLPRLASGELLGATAITEPGGGSDVRGMVSIAEPTANGFLLTGRKTHVTNLPVANIVMVLVKIKGEEDPRKVGLCLIESPRAICHFDPEEDLVGHRSSPTGGFEFESVAIDRACLVGEVAQPLDHLYNTLALDRALYACAAAGVLAGMLRDTTSFVQARVAFGKSIIQHQHVQRRFTDMIANREIARLVAFDALAKLQADSDDAVMACSLAKLVATEGLIGSTQANMAIHGHRGYMAGPIARMALDALGSRIAAGTNDIQRVNIANQFLRLSRRDDMASAVVSATEFPACARTDQRKDEHESAAA